MLPAVPPTLGARHEKTRQETGSVILPTSLSEYEASINAMDGCLISRAQITVAFPLRTTRARQGSFGAQLSGPFRHAVGIGFSPVPDSLCLAT